MVEAGLVTGNASVDFILAALDRLAHEGAVGEHRPRHRHQIGIAARQNLLRDIRHVDPVGGDHRYIDFLAQTAGYRCKRSPGNHRGDGRHGTFMPCKMSRNDGHTGFFQSFGQRDDLLPAHAVFQHVHCRDAKNQDEVLTNRGAGLLDDLDRETDAVFVAAAIFIFAQIGFLDQKGRNQIAGRPDNLDPVIARLFCHHRAADMVADLLFDAGLVEFVGDIARNPRLHRRRGNAIRRIGQRTGV